MHHAAHLPAAITAGIAASAAAPPLAPPCIAAACVRWSGVGLHAARSPHWQLGVGTAGQQAGDGYQHISGRSLMLSSTHTQHAQMHCEVVRVLPSART